MFYPQQPSHIIDKIIVSTGGSDPDGLKPRSMRPVLGAQWHEELWIFRLGRDTHVMWSGKLEVGIQDRSR